MRSKLLKNSIELFKGAGLSQVLTLGILPVLTRLYTTEQLGEYFLYVAIAGLLSVGLSLQSHMTIVLAKNKDEADKNLFFSLITNIITHLLLYFFIIIVNYISIKNLIPYSIPKLLYLYPIGSFFLSVQLAIEAYLNFNSDYKALSKTKVIRVVVMILVQVFAVMIYKSNVYILVYGHLFGILFVFIYCFRKIKLVEKKLSYNNFVQLIKHYRQIVVFNTGISLINSASNQLPFILIKIFYGADAVGYYGMALRIIGTPLNLMGQNIGLVFYKKSAERINSNAYLRILTKSVIFSLMKIGIIPVILVLVGSKLLVYWFLGEEWVVTANLILFITPWLFIAHIRAAISYLITILKLQKAMLFYELVLLFSRVLMLVLGYYVFSNLESTIGLFSLVGLILNLAIIYSLWKSVLKYDQQLKSTLSN